MDSEIICSSSSNNGRILLDRSQQNMSNTIKTEQISPLLNHLILDKIYNNLCFCDLKTCRLVCSVWNETVLKKKLNKLSEVCLESLSLEQFLNNLKQALEPNCSICSNPGFENYKLKINSVLSTEKNMQIVWDQVGNRIKSLKLEMTTLYARDKLGEILLEDTDLLQNVQISVNKYLGSNANEGVELTSLGKPLEATEIRPNPNLTSFSYSYLGAMSLRGFEDRDRYEADYKFPISWSEFFARFPNLERLSVIGLFEIEVMEMLSTLLQLHKKHQRVLPNLRILDILEANIYPEAPNNDNLQILMELNPSLTELQLEISPILRTILFNKLLISLLPTLKVLRLRRFLQPYNFDERISLKVAMAGVTFLEVSNSLVPSLAFLPFFPNLEKFHIILRDYRNLPICDIVATTPASIEPHYKLKNVYIEPPLKSENCITKLLSLVPNLSRLKVRLSNAMLRALCASPVARCGLRDLHIISWGELTDEGFTGIPESALKDTNFNRDDLELCRIHPYIGDLRNLQTLVVEMCSDVSNDITDTSVLYGFVDLIGLQEFKAIRTSITTSGMSLMNFTKSTFEN